MAVQAEDRVLHQLPNSLLHGPGRHPGSQHRKHLPRAALQAQNRGQRRLRGLAYNLGLSALFLVIYLIPLSKCLKVFRTKISEENLETFKSAASSAHYYMMLFMAVTSLVILSWLFTLIYATFFMSFESHGSKALMISVCVISVIFYSLIMVPFVWLFGLYHQNVLPAFERVEADFFDGYQLSEGACDGVGVF